MPPASDSRVTVILPAAGSGQRFGDVVNKLFAPLGGRPLWTHAAGTLAAHPRVNRIVLAASARDRDVFESQVQSFVWDVPVDIVLGGDQRSDSVAAALDAIADDTCDWIAIHDAARPLVRESELTAVFDAASRTGAALLASPVSGTLKRRDSTQSSRTVDRTEMWTALTPQVFAADTLRQAYQRHRGRPATDDAQLVERMGLDVTIVPGSADNLKITYPDDLPLAQAILDARNHHPLPRSLPTD